LICRLIFGNGQIVVCQIASDPPRLRVVDQIRKRRTGVVQRRRKTPPKAGDLLRGLAPLQLMESHKAVFNRRPKTWCDFRNRHTHMIVLFKLEFNDSGRNCVHCAVINDDVLV